MEAVRTGFLEYTDKVFRRSGYEIHGVLWTYLKCSYPMEFSSVEEDTFSSVEEREEAHLGLWCLKTWVKDKWRQAPRRCAAVCHCRVFGLQAWFSSPPQLNNLLAYCVPPDCAAATEFLRLNSKY